jgi:kumamolisin
MNKFDSVGFFHRPASLSLALVVGSTLCGLSAQAQAQSAHGNGTVWIPESSIEGPNQAGLRAHTNVRVLVPYAGMGALMAPSPHAQAGGHPPYAGYFYETPASLACIYGLTSPVAGCNPAVVTAAPAGGKGAIAIVDAYDNPTLAQDLTVFSTQFGLAAANFSIVYASGRRPAQDSSGGWELEASLDVEWAHAMAPAAQIFLVEAASSSMSDLITAVTMASQLVAAHGGGEVSMSWASSEFAGERSYDAYFATPKVVYVASAGDSPGVGYPSASPNVISAGGTSTSRSPTTGAYVTETAWQPTGGGPSAYEPRPAFQAGVAAAVGATRGTPDLSFDADTITGVWVYSSFGGPSWYVVGGTSVAAPALSGIINAAGKLALSSAAELATIYANGATGTGYRAVTVGNCGPYGGFLAAKTWNFCTGNGVVNGLAGK